MAVVPVPVASPQGQLTVYPIGPFTAHLYDLPFDGSYPTGGEQITAVSVGLRTIVGSQIWSHAKPSDASTMIPTAVVPSSTGTTAQIYLYGVNSAVSAAAAAHLNDAVTDLNAANSDWALALGHLTDIQSGFTTFKSNVASIETALTTAATYMHNAATALSSTDLENTADHLDDMNAHWAEFEAAVLDQDWATAAVALDNFGDDGILAAVDLAAAGTALTESDLNDAAVDFDNFADDMILAAAHLAAADPEFTNGAVDFDNGWDDLILAAAHMNAVSLGGAGGSWLVLIGASNGAWDLAGDQGILAAVEMTAWATDLDGFTVDADNWEDDQLLANDDLILAAVDLVVGNTEFDNYADHMDLAMVDYAAAFVHFGADQFADAKVDLDLAVADVADAVVDLEVAANLQPGPARAYLNMVADDLTALAAATTAMGVAIDLAAWDDLVTAATAFDTASTDYETHMNDAADAIGDVTTDLVELPAATDADAYTARVLFIGYPGV